MFKLLIICLFFTVLLQASFHKEHDKIIKFKGEEKYLMHLLIASYFNHQHPFSQTPVIRKRNSSFIHTGDILSLKEKDYQDIHNKNYVYLDNHTHMNTRLNPEEPVRVSLLILGTKDKESCLKLTCS